MFIAPSQLKKVAEHFSGIAFQIVVTRTRHKDILTVKIDVKRTGFDRLALQAQFEKIFQEICTVKLDTVEFLEPGALKDDSKVIIDERVWQ